MAKESKPGVTTPSSKSDKTPPAAKGGRNGKTPRIRPRFVGKGRKVG